MSAQLGGSVMSLNVRTSCHNGTGSELDLVENLKLNAGQRRHRSATMAASLEPVANSYQSPV